MEHCSFCGAELPNSAHFCGNCGAPNNCTSDTPTNISGWHIIDMPGGSGVVDMVDVSPSDFNTPTVTANFNMPTFISNPSHPTLSNGLQNQADETVRGVLAPDRYNPETPLPESSLSEDEEQNILLPDLSPWETLAGNVQAPGNVPVVHGTPNISGVPVVHGTPPAAT